MSNLPDLLRYRTIVFDCDGVILNSNAVKTRAFFEAARPYGISAAQALVDYHVVHGGVSRYQKFNYFLSEIVGQPVTEEALSELLRSFASFVRQGLLECEVTPSLPEVRRVTHHARWMIVSGGDQAELRSVFAERDLDAIFDGGIFGSPDTKEEILRRETANENIRPPALFVGDSRYDHLAAVQAGLDFVFLTAWTELKDWENYTTSTGIATANSLADLHSQQHRS